MSIVLCVSSPVQLGNPDFSETVPLPLLPFPPLSTLSLPEVPVFFGSVLTSVENMPKVFSSSDCHRANT